MNPINRREMLTGLVAAPIATAVGAEEPKKGYSFKKMIEALQSSAPGGWTEEHYHEVPKANRDRFIWDGMGSDNGLDLFPRVRQEEPVAWVLTGDRRIAAEWMRKQGSTCASFAELDSLAELCKMALGIPSDCYRNVSRVHCRYYEITPDGLLCNWTIQGQTNVKET